MDDVLRDPHGAEYLSGCRVILSQFAGQLGDGAVCYLGEVETGAEQSSDPTNRSLCRRWEIQVKGSGLTPYSR